MFDAKKTKNEIIQWIKNYFERNGKNSIAIVPISGGKDSSIVAALCVEALGKDRVYGLMLPHNLQIDIDISCKLIKHLNIYGKAINIKNTIDAMYSSLEGFDINDIVKNNTPARIRMTIAYAISGAINGRVANTSNLSEHYVGWNTKFGDNAGDFAPLANLTCTEVIAVGKELGLPDKFIYKIPEDGLTNRSDEENFGFSYDILDKYIRTGICQDKSIKEKIDKMHQYGLHKILPMPSFNYRGDNYYF